MSDIISVDENPWRSMETFPKDGTVCDILCQNDVIATEIYWGFAHMGRERVLRGLQNILSPYLVPHAWRKHIKLNVVPVQEGEKPEVRNVKIGA